MISIRLLLGAIFLLAGVFFFACAVYGLFKFDYVLNRMHCGGLGDSFALGLSILGLILIRGFSMASLKLLLIPLLLIFSSPVSSHLIMRFVVDSDEKLKEHCEVEEECR